MNISRLLVVVVALQCFTLYSQFSSHPVGTPAMAQIPDAGAQRNLMVDELKSMNQKLDGITELLASGQLQVHVSGVDEDKQDNRAK